MDHITKEQRSKIMSSIKAKSHLEDIVTHELWQRGIRFRRNVRSLYGTPDIAIKKYKIVIFIDSCFWHCCPEHFRMPKSNLEYWEKKFEKNKKHDAEVTAFYQEQGWKILRFWEHEIKQDLTEVIDKMEKEIEASIEENHKKRKPYSSKRAFFFNFFIYLHQYSSYRYKFLSSSFM